MPRNKQKTELRSKTVTMRVTDEEFKCLSRKAEEAGLSVSELTRRASLEKPVQHIHDGKRVAEQLALLQGKFQEFHHDMASRVQQLQEAIRENTGLFAKVGGFCSPDMQEAFLFQKERIDAVAGMLMAVYGANEQKIEDGAHDIIKQMGTGESI